MVSIQTTSKKYRGQMAAKYESKRKPQIRWSLENEIVTTMLQGAKGLVLDCPVGTGRYLKLYRELKLDFIGIDSSEEMLALARKKKLGDSLEIGDATNLNYKPRTFNHAVCIRFLDLIDEDAMQQTIKELCRVTRHTIICTIRFGDKYVPKVNTATHDEKKFKALIKRLGWKIAEERAIFGKGWFVLKLQPQEK
jgi:ubiquinone/menaquinone biosynthesis C-methylase UbiE